MLAFAICPSAIPPGASQWPVRTRSVPSGTSACCWAWCLLRHAWRPARPRRRGRGPTWTPTRGCAWRMPPRRRAITTLALSMYQAAADSAPNDTALQLRCATGLARNGQHRRGAGSAARAAEGASARQRPAARAGGDLRGDRAAQPGDRQARRGAGGAARRRRRAAGQGGRPRPAGPSRRSATPVPPDAGARPGRPGDQQRPCGVADDRGAHARGAGGAGAVRRVGSVSRNGCESIWG